MNKKNIADSLTKALAETFVLYFKTHSFHWNVTGPHFKPLHELFEEQYTELWTATDELAERIRILGEWAPTNYIELEKHASLKGAHNIPDANGMVEQLADDNRAITKTLYDVLHTAEEEGDEATVDMMVGRINVHEKAAWMLESSLSKAA